ncbi:MAG: response regulator [Magnetococcales bacterium]|nr:response regulator [Magnetococcales bacterium]
MDARPILLVEDNPDDVELTLLAFQKHHLANSIDVVRDGAEALSYLYGEKGGSVRSKENMPALILLDLKLPRVSGLDVLKRLRAESCTRRIPVVILTTSDDGSDLRSGYDLGVNSYIRKPVDFDQFIDVVKNLGLYWLMMNTPPPMD